MFGDVQALRPGGVLVSSKDLSVSASTTAGPGRLAWGDAERDVHAHEHAAVVVVVVEVVAPATAMVQNHLPAL